MKSVDLLKAQAFSALMHDGAIRFYDDVYVDGTMSEHCYEKMGEVYSQLEPYEEFAGGKLYADIAIYVNFESGMNFGWNGEIPVGQWEGGRLLDVWQTPPYPGICAAKTLLNMHAPFTVITRKNLADLASYKIVVLPNIAAMDDEEAEAFRQFVAKGGNLYASKFTSLYDKEGGRREDFLLADLFGAHYEGETKEAFSYCIPTGNGADVFAPFSGNNPMSIPASQLYVKAEKAASVLASIVNSADSSENPESYGQIHVHMPGQATTYPALLKNAYGRGKVIYAAGVLEGLTFDAQRQVYERIIQSLAPERFSIQTNAPKSVEIVMYSQPANKRFILHHLNFQDEQPNIAVRDLVVRLSLNDIIPERLYSVGVGRDVQYEIKDGLIEYSIACLKTYAMFVLFCE